jgi:hypothetical protein
VAHLLRSPIEQVEEKVNVKSIPQENLSRVKVSFNLKVKLNKKIIIFVLEIKLLH